MVELRKRKTPPPAAPSKPKKTKAATSKIAKAKEAVVEKLTGTADKSKNEAANGDAKSTGPPAVGDVIDFDGFGGEVETNEGVKVTLKQLVDESKAGVVLFTYPKASTPGCKSILFMPCWT